MPRLRRHAPARRTARRPPRLILRGAPRDIIPAARPCPNCGARSSHMSDDPTLDLELPEDAADDLTAAGPDDPATLRRLADGYLEADRPAEAAAVLSRLVDLAPADYEPLEERAWTNLASGAIDAARADMALLLER